MAETRCFCGAGFTAPGDDALVPMLQDHLRGAHGIEAGDITTRNAIERQRRLPPPPPRAGRLGRVAVRAVGPDIVDEVAAFFDEVAFTDNVGWASCYCMYHHVAAATWEGRSWQENRRDLCSRIAAGTTTGVLATVDGSPAGWVNAGRLEVYPAHARDEGADSDLGAIVCFAVGPAYRGHGLATLLLDAACDLLRGMGVRGVEAYPARQADSAAAAYHGTAEMYRRAGFREVRDGVVYRDL